MLKNYDQSQIGEIITKMIIIHKNPFMIDKNILFNILLKVFNDN